MKLFFKKYDLEIIAFFTLFITILTLCVNNPTIIDFTLGYRSSNFQFLLNHIFIIHFVFFMSGLHYMATLGKYTLYGREYGL